MDIINHDHGGSPQPLSPEALALFTEGVALVFSRWTALQMAVQGQWGGRNSNEKADIMVQDLVSWFVNSKEPLYIDVLEDMLDENMLASFQAEIGDGSVEEVAEQLMIMHEDCLQGNFESIFRLRNSNTGARAVSQSMQVVDENVSESSEEESGRMVDNMMQQEASRDTEMRNQESEDAEGWSLVVPRRNRGRRSC